jgi:hypothetical protein
VTRPVRLQARASLVWRPPWLAFAGPSMRSRSWLASCRGAARTQGWSHEFDWSTSASIRKRCSRSWQPHVHERRGCSRPPECRSPGEAGDAQPTQSAWYSAGTPRGASGQAHSPTRSCPREPSPSTTIASGPTSTPGSSSSCWPTSWSTRSPTFSSGTTVIRMSA